MSTEESSSSTKLSQAPSPSRGTAMDAAASGTAGQPLTSPSEPKGNQGWDNEHNDLIVYTQDVLHNEFTNNSYWAMDKLGQGTFGQVVRCYSELHRCFVAVKIIKNQAAYHQQAMVEVKILQSLNREYNPEHHNFVQLLDYFRFKNHLCLVFELLQRNLFELIRCSNYQGFSLGLVNHFIKQVLKTLTVLQQERIIHADLKPENVLLEDEKSGVVKVIDFGSSCMEHETVYSYIQSRFYRSPEVVLAYPYDSAIDMWSLGCIAAELYLGLPLFPAASERDLLARIIEILGPFPIRMLAASRRVRRYFKLKPAAPAGSQEGEGQHHHHDSYRLMSQPEFEEHNQEAAPTARKYFQYSTLPEIVTKCKTPSRNNPPEDPRCFLDFLSGLLQIDPQRRWNAEQAVTHPFISGAPFVGPFHPPPTAPRQKSRPVGIGAMHNARYHSASWHPNAAAHCIAHEAAMLAVSQLTNSVASNSSQLAQWTGSTVNNGTMPGVSPETISNPVMMAAMRAAQEAAFSNPSCPSSFQSATQPAASPGHRRIQGFHVAPRQQQMNGDVPTAIAEHPQGQTALNSNRLTRPMAGINENGPQVDEGRSLAFDLDQDPPSSHSRTQPRHQLPSNCTSSNPQQQRQQQQQPQPQQQLPRNNNSNISSVGMDGRSDMGDGSGDRGDENGVSFAPGETGAMSQRGPGLSPWRTPLPSDKLHRVMGNGGGGVPSSLSSQLSAHDRRQGPLIEQDDCVPDGSFSERSAAHMDGSFSFLRVKSLLSSAATFSSQSDTDDDDPWNEGISNDSDDAYEVGFYGGIDGGSSRIEKRQQRRRPMRRVDSAEVHQQQQQSQLDLDIERPQLVDDASDS